MKQQDQDRQRGQALEIVREFDAPREQVMRSWVEPDHEGSAGNGTVTVAGDQSKTRVTVKLDEPASSGQKQDDLRQSWEQCFERLNKRLQSDSQKKVGRKDGKTENEQSCEVVDEAGRQPRCEL